MEVSVNAGDAFWFFGDSITHGSFTNEGNYPWPSAPGALIDQMRALVLPGVTPSVVTVTGPVATATGAKATSVPLPGTIFASTFGVGGASMNDIADYLPAQLASVPISIASPVFVIEGGTNDATPDTCTSGGARIISQLQATWPNCRIIFMSCWVLGESWLTGPPPAWNAFSVANLDPKNVAIKAIAATARNGAYVDTRNPTLAWEVINNPTQVASGLASVDGEHPTIVGMVQTLAPAFLAAIPVGP